MNTKWMKEIERAREAGKEGRRIENLRKNNEDKKALFSYRVELKQMIKTMVV